MKVVLCILLGVVVFVIYIFGVNKTKNGCGGNNCMGLSEKE